MLGEFWNINDITLLIFIDNTLKVRKWKIVVGITARLLTGRSDVEIPAGEEIFLFSRRTKPALESTQPHIQWVPIFFRLYNLPSRDVYHSTQSSAKGKNECSCTSPLPVSPQTVDSYSFTLYCTRPTIFSFCVFWQNINLIRLIFNWLHPVTRVSNVKKEGLMPFSQLKKATKLTSGAAWTTNIPQSAQWLLVVLKLHTT